MLNVKKVISITYKVNKDVLLTVLSPNNKSVSVLVPKDYSEKKVTIGDYISYNPNPKRSYCDLIKVFKEDDVIKKDNLKEIIEEIDQELSELDSVKNIRKSNYNSGHFLNSNKIWVKTMWQVTLDRKDFYYKHDKKYIKRLRNRIIKYPLDIRFK